jgi:hypothetical protein
VLKNLNMAEYLATEAISKSGLDQIAKSPAHYQAWLRDKPEPTTAMVFGSALHCALLEPERFHGVYVQSPKFDRRTNAGKAEAADWEKSNAGKIPLSPDQWQTLHEMQDAFHSHKLISGVLGGAQIERCAFWTDQETGVLCKSRPDIVTSDGLVLDLKTTEDAAGPAFSRSAWNYRYHVQAAMYLEGVSQALGKKHEAFLFIAIEKTAPYAINVHMADQVFVGTGREHMRRDLLRYAECLHKNQWPGYPQEVQTLTLPQWAV